MDAYDEASVAKRRSLRWPVKVDKSTEYASLADTLGRSAAVGARRTIVRVRICSLSSPAATSVVFFFMANTSSSSVETPPVDSGRGAMRTTGPPKSKPADKAAISDGGDVEVLSTTRGHPPRNVMFAVVSR